MAKKPNTKKSKGELGLLSLTALVVGSMIGGGIFNLMQDMSAEASLLAIIIGWLIAGVGMVLLAFSFQNLNRKRPDLDAGVYSYAEAGFGKFMGFSSAWGYWISAWIGNVSYAALLFGSVAYFFSLFDDGRNTASVIGASVMLWLVALLISRGIKASGLSNLIVTIAKLVPIGIFVVAIMTAFKYDLLTADVWGKMLEGSPDLLTQIKSTTLITVWVFIGVEGAVIFSGRSKKRSDVSKATFIGLSLVTAIYLLTTILSLAVLSQPKIAGLSQPAMAGVLEAVVGEWGAILVNLGLVVSVLGGWLAWTMFAVELPYQAAKNKTFPKWFANENSRGVPTTSLIITSVLVQLFLLSFLIPNLNAYSFLFSLASSAILVPYLFVALFQLKLSLKEKKSTAGRTRNIIIGALATVYAVWLLYAADINYMLLSVLLYAPGALVYAIMRINQKKKPFTTLEWVVVAGLVLVAIYAVSQLAISGSDLNLILFPAE
ncbi:arginine-ornithine antiporter [Candidatus Saccharibacteria bacterium]|nr:MAG: arginine-ornithine antiporter [Candidatus Saccharibacteria bacterium]